MDTMPLLARPSVDAVTRWRVWTQRAAVLAIWMVALVVWRRYQASNDLSATGTAQVFIDHVEAAWWGVVAYVAVYLARPIVLFPASVLTVVGGLLFGPVYGVIVVVIAANGSATIAYLIGRLLGHTPGDSTAEAAATVLSRWSTKMRHNSFETVLVMRFLFLPYDVVSYAAGMLRIRWAPFATATALGSVPGTISFVLLGASLDRVDRGVGGLEPVALAAGAIIFLASLVIARIVKRRQDVTTTPDDLTTEQSNP